MLLPFFGSLLGRIESKPHEHVIASPGEWTAALLKGMNLLQTDGIIAGYDDVLLVHAMGALAEDPLQHPGLAAAVETVKRLAAPASRNYACVARMAGPGKLTGQLFPPREIEAGMRAIKKQYMAVSESYLKTQPDMLLLFERIGGVDGSLPPHLPGCTAR